MPVPVPAFVNPTSFGTNRYVFWNYHVPTLNMRATPDYTGALRTQPGQAALVGHPRGA